jgi:hypothetical protein
MKSLPAPFILVKGKRINWWPKLARWLRAGKPKIASMQRLVEALIPAPSK